MCNKSSKTSKHIHIGELPLDNIIIRTIFHTGTYCTTGHIYIFQDKNLETYVENLHHTLQIICKSAIELKDRCFFDEVNTRMLQFMSA